MTDTIIDPIIGASLTCTILTVHTALANLISQQAYMLHTVKHLLHTCSHVQPLLNSVDNMYVYMYICSSCDTCTYYKKNYIQPLLNSGI